MRANGLEIQTLEVGGAPASGGSNPNLLINGGFDIWQRATTQSTSGYGSDDRWNNSFNGGGMTAQRGAFDVGQTDVPDGGEYLAYFSASGQSLATHYGIKIQYIEDLSLLAGKTVTLSFYALADASRNMSVEAIQVFGAGGSAEVDGDNHKIALTTGWVYHEMTFDIPSITGKTVGAGNATAIVFWASAGSNYNARTDSLGINNGTIGLSRVKLEVGSVATPFIRRPKAEELALCQRYYATGQLTGDNVAVYASGYAYGSLRYHTTMRAAPTGTCADLQIYVSGAWRSPSSVYTIVGATNGESLINVQDSAFTVVAQSFITQGTYTLDAEL